MMIKADDCATESMPVNQRAARLTFLDGSFDDPPDRVGHLPEKSIHVGQQSVGEQLVQGRAQTASQRPGNQLGMKRAVFIISAVQRVLHQFA